MLTIAGNRRGRRFFRSSLLTICFVTACLTASKTALAAENGAGIYLLGSKGPDAALLPPPGIFLQNDLYIYRGNLGGSRDLPLGGNIVANVKATPIIEMPTILWSTPWSIFGGRIGISLTEPIGGPSVDATVTAGPFAGGKSDSIFTLGDPVPGATIAWDVGNFHWAANAIVNVPIGDYRNGGLANVAIHRWATDLNGAMTWLDPQTGWEASGILGVTFNGENPATDYRTGTEFHAEWSVTKALTKQFSAGLVGYYYQQLTGDSGSGAKLGSFEGRTVALGGTVAYNFQVGKLPVSTRLKVYREFDVKNRAEGTGGFVTVAFPLAVFE